MKIEWVQQCASCKGRGVYVGIAERNGAAVVCHTCDGTGRQQMSVEYEEFTGIKIAQRVRRVYQASCGIVTDPDVVPGGVPYAAWQLNHDAAKEQGAELRTCTCPAWWYQNVDYDRKPEWPECIKGGQFSDCKHFPTKDKCWERSDREAPGDT